LSLLEAKAMDPLILLVEDDENKRSQIVQFIQSTWTNAGIEAASSFQTGLRTLKEGNFTFVILDMTLPNYDVGSEEDGGELRQLGGQEFLRRMKRGRLLVPTVILTQYETFGSGRDRVDLESIRALLQNMYGNFCRGVIYYNSALDSWKQELKDSINSTQDTGANT
jgi:CheY-like chemotaxis protein